MLYGELRWLPPEEGGLPNPFQSTRSNSPRGDPRKRQKGGGRPGRASPERCPGVGSQGERLPHHRPNSRRPRGPRRQCRDAKSSAARLAPPATPAGRTTARVETTGPPRPTAVGSSPRRASRPRPSSRAAAHRTLPALADRVHRVLPPTPACVVAPYESPTGRMGQDATRGGPPVSHSKSGRSRRPAATRQAVVSRASLRARDGSGQNRTRRVGVTFVLPSGHGPEAPDRCRALPR